MSGYYLRVAGTNFDGFVADTQDLSTLRGGSLLLRAMIDEAAAIHGGLAPVSTGASEGLFRFDAADDAAAESVRRAIEGGLPARIEALRHATFTVDWVHESGDFRRDKQRAVALGRWRQVQSPSLAVPSPAGNAAEPCAADRLRPASGKRTLREQPISESVYLRREYGRLRKQDFYQRETGQSGEPGIRVEAGYSHDLEQLTAAPERGNLDGKMAVLYIDGNAFGALQDRHVKSAADQAEFDRHLRETRRGVLREMVRRAEATPALREGGGGPVRLETLLWGGDEIAWVLPGWAGLWAVDLFFRDPGRFRFRGETLTHAAGLVLCRHGAPIHRMRRLAEDLAGLAKTDRSRNLLAYEVLESFDEVGDDLDAYRRSRRPTGADARMQLLAPERIGEAVAAYGALAAALPSRQVHKAARALFGRDEPGFAAALDQIRASLRAEGRDAGFERLLRALGGTWPPADGRDPAPWQDADRAGILHLASLADYLVPLEEEGDA